MLFCVTRAILWLLVQEIQTGKIYAIYIASYNNDTHCKLILNFHDPWPCAYKYRYKHKQVLIDTILVMKFTMDRFCSIRRRDYEHRYIKPCFLVLGLDFYHFNRSSSFFCPGSLEIYIYIEFKSVSSKIVWRVWSRISFLCFLANFDGWKSIQWVIKRFFSIV